MIVTGAASGIGRAIALELAGAPLLLVDRNEAGLAEVAAECPNAKALAVDLTAPDAADRVIDAALEHTGSIEALYNVAGIALVGAAEASSRSEWEAVLDVNLRAPIALTQLALPHMRSAGRGAVVFVASLAGLVPTPGLAAYAASKFGIVGYAEAISAELVGTGITVGAVCPGYVRTGLVDASTYHSDGFESFLRAFPSWYGLSAEGVAKRTIEVGKSGGIIALGPEKVGWWLWRLSPRLANRAARLLVKRSGFL